MLITQYRGNHTENFAKKVLNIAATQIVFITRLLKTSLPSLKSVFSSELKSKMTYKLESIGYKSIYVGQTVRHFTTRVEEHRKTDTNVEQYLKKCGDDGLCSELNWKIIEQANSKNELLTLGAAYLKREARTQYTQRV